MPILKEQMRPPLYSKLERGDLIERVVECAKENGLGIATIDNVKGLVTLDANFKIFDMGLWRCYASRIAVEISFDKSRGTNTVNVYGLPNLRMLRLKGPDNYDAVKNFVGGLTAKLLQ